MKSIRSGFYFDCYLESLNISFALSRIKLKKIWIIRGFTFSYSGSCKNEILIANSLNTSTKKAMIYHSFLSLIN